MYRVYFSCIAVWLAGCHTPSSSGTGQAPKKPAPAAKTQIPDVIVIDHKTHELGWKKLSPSSEGWRVRAPFESSANEAEWTLAVAHTGVTEQWQVLMNQRKLGYLDPHRGATTSYLPVPPGTVVDGQNVVEVVTDGGEKPIFVNDIQLLIGKNLDAVVALGTVRVEVRDASTGKPVPGRVTVADMNEKWVQMFRAEGEGTAARLGVVYTMNGPASFQLPEGVYMLHATRGMEWSLASQSVHVRRGGEVSINLALRHEVKTPGYVAADTHLHTAPFSGDASASLEERLVTLAGEGVEFAVATDHNHNTDFRPASERLGTTDYFYSVTGNEVTTQVGHFNGFPLKPDDSIPDAYLGDFVKIVADIREHGAQVVILNHPRYPTVNDSPFEKADLNQITGDAASDLRLTVDAMELVNTNTLIDDPLVLFADWFALLNRGETVTAVGSSDTHTVEAVPGQARTYVRSDAARPAEIVESEIYESFRKGRTSISMGIYVELALPDGHELGDLLPVHKGRFELGVRVAAPGWVRPRKVLLFLNGQRIAQQDIEIREGEASDIKLSFTVNTPPHDGHLVCVVVGEPPREPVWFPVKDYALGATNPVYLDGDGDGKYRSPRATAARELARLGTDLRRIERALPNLDPVIGAQVLSLFRHEIDKLVDGQAPRHQLAVPRPHTQIHDQNEAHAHH